MKRDAAAELVTVRHMQLARGTGEVVALHKRLNNSTAALLTAVAAHEEREE
jgi:hypothetical protein